MMLPGRILILLSTPDDNEVTLEERYANDLWLLGFYKDKLFDPGWSGELDAVGLEYIKSQLNKSLVEALLGVSSFGQKTIRKSYRSRSYVCRLRKAEVGFRFTR